LHLLRVTFFAAVVLLTETLFFHVFNYIHDYFIAILAISFAILGIGIGAFLAEKIKTATEDLFLSCVVGTTITLYLSVTVIIGYPALWLLSIVTPLAFVFPVVYITRAFKDSQSNLVYLYDMIGAGLGLIVTILLFKILITEEVVLLLLVTLPFIAFWEVQTRKKRSWQILASVYICLSIVALILLWYQYQTNKLNLFFIVNRTGVHFTDPSKVFVRLEGEKLVKSYDSLIGRIDILKRGKSYHLVIYDGHGNDHFTNAESYEYEYYLNKHGKWTTSDVRVLYRIVDEPRVFIIGSSAQGIIKTLKRITPVENLIPVEINPGILKAMQVDFYEDSGQAYKNLKPQLGNGLSVIKSSDELFDIITFINTHSSRSISHRGPPDYLHTYESYNAYFDHLSDEGYLLLEERLMDRGGELGFYRMINTMWNTLKDRGAEDPSKHFVIWEWMGVGQEEFKRNTNKYYISMIVTKEPIPKDKHKIILRGIERMIEGRPRPTRFTYMKGEEGTNEYEQLFAMIEKGDFSQLEHENFNSALITNNRPFSTFSTKDTPVLNNLLMTVGAACLLLWGLFSFGVRRKKIANLINLYNVFIGMGYFIIEIILMLTYQNVFTAPSATFLLVLAVLLISSGIGGFFIDRFKIGIVTIVLIPVSLITIAAPTFLLTLPIPFILVEIVSVILIAITGFFMGMYFPRGLQIAKDQKLTPYVPHFFAINSIAGSFAVVLALFLGVTVGYKVAIIVVILLYALAGLILRSAENR